MKLVKRKQETDVFDVYENGQPFGVVVWRRFEWWGYTGEHGYGSWWCKDRGAAVAALKNATS